MTGTTCGVKLGPEGNTTHKSGVSTTGETVAYEASEAATVPLSRTRLLAASRQTAAAIILHKHKQTTLASSSHYYNYNYYNYNNYYVIQVTIVSAVIHFTVQAS